MNISIKDIFNAFQIEFKALGFEHSKWYNHNNCFEFWMEEKERICLFSINYTKVKAFYKLSNIFNADIIFKDVNNIFQKFINLDREYSVDSFEATIQSIPNYDNHLNILFDLPKYEINTKDEFDIVKNKVIAYFKEYPSSFFDQIPNLQTVNKNILNQVPQSEYTKYIKGKATFKILIIMKLCNNSKYDDYKNWAVKGYKELVIENSQMYTKEYQILIELLDYLDRGLNKELLKA